MYSRLGRKGRSAVLRSAVRQKLERADREMLGGIDLGDIGQVYDVMNRRWWDGELKLKVLELGDCGKGADGLYTPIDKAILIDEELDELDRVGVLLHEMCHLSVDLRYDYLSIGEKTGRIPWHGKRWKEEMGRVGFGGVVNSYSGEDRFSWYRSS